MITLDPATRALQGLVRSFQLVSIYPTLTVAEMVAVGNFARQRKTFCMFRPASWFFRERTETESIVEAFWFDASHEYNVFHSFSRREEAGGHCKLAYIASRLILMDEPTSGIASADKHGIMEKLLAATKALGVESLVLVEHDMELIARYATRVIGLRSGQIVADLPPSGVFPRPARYQIYRGKGSPKC